MRLLVIPFVLFASVLFAQSPLQHRIDSIAHSIEGTVGVAVKNFDTGETLFLNRSDRFPMQSVFKFLLGMCVLDKVDKKQFRLDQKIHFQKADYIPNTWSPIAKAYPDGNVSLPLKEVIVKTVSNSDNNGCDALFRLIGGPSVLDRYVKALGVHDINIIHTEAEMHQGYDIQFSNWSTPEAMLNVLELLNNKTVLQKPSHDLLWDAMLNTTTGPKRIKGLLPPTIKVIHKTGSGGRNDAGEAGALNDVGIIQLPDGTSLGLVVFITRARSPYEQLEEAIALIAKSVVDHYKP